MIPFIGRPVLIAGAVIVGLTFLWGGWHYLRAERAEKALLEYQAAAAAVIAERLTENAELERQASQKLQDITHAYETRLGTLRARYDRLRESADRGSSLPQTTAGLPGTVDATDGDQLPRCVEAHRREELIELLEAADTCIERLRACQQR